MSKRTNKVVFKNYTPNQMLLLPPSLDEKIAEHHPVRVVNQVIEQINIEPLVKKYEGGGTSSYHPKMLLKVMVYAYLNNVYSSRKIEESLQQNIHFMWLSGMNEPDHNTINRFRGERLKEVLKPIFTQVVLLLSEAGLVNLKELYVDGTKIEANANRYTFVWGKSIENNKEKIKKQLEELWSYTQQVAAEEMQDSEPLVFEKIDAQQVQQTIARIDEALQGKEVSQKVKQKLRYAKKEWPENLKKYEAQEKIMGSRNSYSKSDPDATFMRMKEDHMKNGQLKPAYNLQISTNDQIITNYTIHPNPTDTTTLPKHLEEYKASYGQTPEIVTTDAGYGSEQNYNYLEKNNIKGFIKYSHFDSDQKKNNDKKDPFHTGKLPYHQQQDCYYCPIGQPMQKLRIEKKKNSNGFEQTIHVYQAKNCTNCPLRPMCHQGEGNRNIQVNHRLNHYKQQAKENLLSPEGIYHRKRRPADVEPVFANLKNNKNFKRFMLRGNKKVEIEVGLLALAHNLKKMAA
jgi:transposase